MGLKILTYLTDYFPNPVPYFCLFRERQTEDPYVSGLAAGIGAAALLVRMRR